MQSYNMIIFIKSQELRSNGISVKVYVQELEGKDWSETTIDRKLSLKIEDIILNKARNMRLNTKK